jgi:hypothetical protein
MTFDFTGNFVKSTSANLFVARMVRQVADIQTHGMNIGKTKHSGIKLFALMITTKTIVSCSHNLNQICGIQLKNTGKS